jgi:hypothetical protein
VYVVRVHASIDPSRAAAHSSFCHPNKTQHTALAGLEARLAAQDMKAVMTTIEAKVN